MRADAIEHCSPRAPLLPDFCSIATLFPLVVIGELLAFVLVLKPGGAAAGMLRDLALTSLFVQWVVLSSSGMLCVLKRYLDVLAAIPAAIVALGLIVAIVTVLSEAAFWLIAGGFIPVAFAPAGTIGDSVLWLAQQEALGLDLAAATHVDFLARNIAIGAIVGAVALRYTYVQKQWQSQVEAESRAHLAALQARIRPHFLFNSMNTIASFTRTQPALAEQVVEDLADLFRATLGAPEASTSAAAELELAEQYLRIEQLRLGTRLKVQWDIDSAAREAQLPTFCLQPLVENAVYHGIEMLSQGGTISISMRRVGAHFEMDVVNDIAPAPQARSGNQFGQENVRQRIQALFAGAATFTVETGLSSYAVRMRMPFHPNDGARIDAGSR